PTGGIGHAGRANKGGPGNLSVSRVHRVGWARQLWSEYSQRVPPGRKLRRPNSQGREAHRSAGTATDQVRASHQSQNSEGNRLNDSRCATRPRRRGDRVRRREFITLLGGAATWPLAARGRQADRTRGIGVLMALAADDPVGQARIAALREGLEKLGWIEGRNIRIDIRWTTTGDVESMQRYAKELVALQPDLIVTQSTPITATLLQETPTIPSVSRSLPIQSAAASSRALPSREETSPVSSL